MADPRQPPRRVSEPHLRAAPVPCGAVVRRRCGGSGVACRRRSHGHGVLPGAGRATGAGLPEVRAGRGRVRVDRRLRYGSPVRDQPEFSYTGLEYEATEEKGLPLLPHVLAATDVTRTLNDVVNEVPWLLQKAGAYLQSRGESRAARPIVERAYQLCRARLDADDEDVLVAASNVAVVLTTLGEHDQALQLNEDSLARCRRVLGHDHPGTLRAATNLAVNLGNLGEHDQARQLNEDTVTRYRQVLGDDHPDTLRSVANLANGLRALDSDEQAHQLEAAPLGTAAESAASQRRSG